MDLFWFNRTQRAGDHGLMDEELIRLPLNGEKLTLGEATAKAKDAVSDEDIRQTWIPFGDPTTKLKY